MRRKKREESRKEAADYIIEKITGGHCIHAKDRAKRMVYCDDCPIGDLRGDLSYDASGYVCSRTRHYSK